MFQATLKFVSRTASLCPLSPSPSQAMIEGQKQARPPPNAALNKSSKLTRVVNEHRNAIAAAMRQPIMASLRRPIRSENRPVSSASAA